MIASRNYAFRGRSRPLLLYFKLFWHAFAVTETLSSVITLVKPISMHEGVNSVFAVILYIISIQIYYTIYYAM